MAWIINIRYAVGREEGLNEVIFSVHNVAAYLVTERTYFLGSHNTPNYKLIKQVEQHAVPSALT